MKIKALIAVALMICSLSGCFNYEEIENGATVAAITIDKEKEFLVSVEIIKASNGGSKSEIVSQKGETVHSALYSLIGVLNNNIYLGHCESLILSPIVAKSGIYEILEYFMVNDEFRKDMIVFVSNTEKASEILEGKNVSGEIVGYEINKSVDADRDYQGSTVYSPLYKVISAIEREKGAALISAIGIENEMVKLDGCIYLCGDKMAGTLSSKETQVMNLLRNDTKEVKTTLGGNGVTLEDISTEIKEKNGTVTLKCSFKMSTLEIKNGDNEAIKKAEESFTDEAGKLIEKMQKSKKLDVFKISTLISEKGTDFRERYEGLEIKPKVKIELKESGITDEKS